MVDLRRFTGTRQRLAVWTVLVVIAGVALVAGAPQPTPIVLGVAGVAWLFGLLALWWLGRRHWRRLAANSRFEAGSSRGLSDLQRSVGGRSVTVRAERRGLLSGVGATVSATAEGADPVGEITMTHVGGGGGEDGYRTGNPTLDDEWIIEGPSGVLEELLSTDVQAALMDVTVPGTLTIDGESVAFSCPFARLEPNELGACATCVAAVADRLASA